MRPSLLGNLDWRALLNVTGDPPLRTRCHRCQKARLGTFEDTTTGGVWHHCHACGWSGDTLALRADEQGIARESRLAELVDRQLLPAAAIAEPALAADRQLRDRHRLFARLWRQARAALPVCPSREIARLRAKFRLHSFLDAPQWRRTCGRGLGCLPAEAIVRALGRRCLPGRGWCDLLVVPFHCAPGRLAGLLVIGRSGEPADRVYLPIGRAHDAGFACWWAVRASRRTLGRWLFLTDDPLLALRLQAKHAAVSPTALPLLAGWHGRRHWSDRSWRAIDRRTPVVWGPTLTSELLRLAILTDGHLALPNPRRATAESTDEHLRRLSPLEWLRVQQRGARPWRLAFQDWAADTDAQEVEDVLRGLESCGLRAGELGLRGRSASLLAPEVAPVRTPIGRKVLIERNGLTWVATRSGRGKEELAASAIVRVDRVIRPEQCQTLAGRAGSTPVYAGRVVYPDLAVPFEVAVDARKETIFRTLVIAVAQHRSNTVLYVDPRWARELMQHAASIASGATVAPPTRAPLARRERGRPKNLPLREIFEASNSTGRSIAAAARAGTPDHLASFPAGTTTLESA